MSTPKSLGKKLRLMRKARQESLLTAAKGIGRISHTHLGRIEKGLTDLTFIQASRIAKYYGISIEEMAEEALKDVIFTTD